MVRVSEADYIASVRDALQYVSYFHPPDFIRSMAAAYEREESSAAKAAIGQVLVNSRMAALGRRPVCQDTGTANVFVKIGAEARLETSRSLQDITDEAVRQAYRHRDNPLRASVVGDPLFARRNSGDNTPSILHVELVAGDRISVDVSAKGGGSENKSRFGVLEPSESVADWVVTTVETMGAGWCPPGILGIGVGGSSEKAMLLAKQALNEPLDMFDLLARGASTPVEKLRVEIYERVNALGIGAQGLGGRTTALDVKIATFPTHAASLPVALIPNCAATRHIHFELDGLGPAHFSPPDLGDWPELVLDHASLGFRSVDLDRISQAEMDAWQPGDHLLLTGTLYTGRDAAHKRMVETIRSGGTLPVDLRNRAIYYVGPVDAVGDEVIGPAGPTTATRMDRFTGELLAATGLKIMIGKAERGAEAIAEIARHRAAYLIAVGGAAYLVSKAIKSARVVAYADLGMEAIYEFKVDAMPVTVAVDTRGQSIHEIGPRRFRQKPLRPPAA
ncbi:MAG: fumarate hydratase [Hyphomicrobiales bacterium]